MNKSKLAFVTIAVLFSLLIPGCSQPSPISTEFSLSELPLLGKPVEVKLTFSLKKSYRGNATITAGIMLPQNIELVNGDLEWQGEIVHDQTYVIQATIKVVKPGYYVIWGRVGGRIPGGSGKNIYIGVFEDSARFYKVGQLPSQVHFEEPKATPIQGTQ